MVEDREAGGFYDEDGAALDTPKNDLEEQFHVARDTKQALITQAIADGTITQEYAQLLQSIHSATTSGDLTNLKKIEAALSLRHELEDTFQSGRVAYVGSGTDWQFAVALGARQIDMVDVGFAETGLRQSLLESIHEVDPQAELVNDEVPLVKFGINLGNGVQNIQMRLVDTDVTRYDSEVPLVGVVECAGPTKSFTSDNPLLPNVRRKLSAGAKVVNFDYMDSHARKGTPQGFQSKSVGKFTVLSAA